jgi:hypothetical protein
MDSGTTTSISPPGCFRDLEKRGPFPLNCRGGGHRRPFWLCLPPTGRPGHHLDLGARYTYTGRPLAGLYDPHEQLPIVRVHGLHIHLDLHYDPVLFDVVLDNSHQQRPDLFRLPSYFDDDHSDVGSDQHLDDIHGQQLLDDGLPRGRPWPS